MEFDWWSTVQPHEKLPYVHVVHWFGVFSLDDEAKSNLAKWNLIDGVQFNHMKNYLMFM